MLITLLAMPLNTGCASLKIPTANVWPFSSEDKPGIPNRVVATWTDTVLYQPNQIPMRGFGGRLLFYDGDKPEPIKVEGTLTVYAFDETNRDPNNAKPDRKYVFTKDQMLTHFSKSKLGSSYSVWIPWDEVGGDQKDISMIVRFTPDKGNVVVSEQTKHLLPGKTQIVAKNTEGNLLPPFTMPPTSMQQSAPDGTVNPVSYITPLPPVNSVNQDGMQNNANQSRRMNTTTIKLPSQSSFKNPPLSGAVISPATSSPDLPRVESNATTNNPTNATNSNVAGTGAVQPASYQDIKAFNTAKIASIKESLNPARPNRFGPGRPLAPSEQALQPSLERGQLQQSPSRQAYFPETSRKHPSTLVYSQQTTSQSSSVNGAQPSLADPGMPQN
jgi:hypothetical protein